MLVSKKTVYVGADIVTMSEKAPKAEAVCIADGRIECVGSREEVLGYAKAGEYDVVDFGGGTLYPGFIDTHSHMSSFSRCLNQVYCGASLGSIAAVQQALRDKAAASDDEWVIGYGYDDSGISDNRHMNRHDLDAVCADRPVMVVHISVHMGYVNTIGLERLGFTADTKVPGGEIVLDGNGLPTGLLLENAIIEASGRLPVPTEAQVRESLVRAIAEYNKKGFTTFQDGGLGINGEAEVFLRPYMELAREGRLNARAYLQLLPSEMDKLISLGVWGIGNDHMKIGGVKYFTDGSIQGFTGALLEDYYTRPGYKGALLWSQEEIDEIIIKYHCLGFQVAVHTNGDAASESVIQAFEKAVERCPRTDLRHMLIHAQLVSDSQLERMKACGIIPSLFARHIEVWGDRHAAIFLGPERTARMDPAGSCVRLGMPFSLHVDTPVLPVTALGSIHAAVNRISDGGVLFGGDQRITPRQALEAYTTYASLCCGGEHDRGRIEPGRFADFVLLDSDIEAIDPSGIRDIKVLKTICGGRVVYEA